ncbi:MAG: amidohydrolase [Candidatus Rokubacteria bacterium]|nr:amidohydrolase [Candidatus Rokubacteria bacterium]
MKFEIIDADGHVTETWEQLQRHLEPPYDKRPPLPPYFPQDGWDRRLTGTLGQSANDGKAWVEACDAGGMAAAVLYPTLGLFMTFLHDPDWAVVLCRAYNSLLDKDFTGQSKRLHGVALLPPQDPTAAAQELRRCVKDYGFVAGMLPADGWSLLGHARFDPIYAAAQELDVPIAFHASGTDMGSAGHEPFPKFIQAHTFSHVPAIMRQLVSTIFEGVPERFPRLKLAYLEAGCGWVPYFVQRMDEEFEKRGHVEAKALRRKPSAYLRSGNIYVSCEADEPLLPQAIEYLGADQILYASDFPHWDNSYPKSLKELTDRDDLSDEVKRKIFSENPRRLYRLT